MLSLFLIFGFSGFDNIAEDQSLYHNNLKFLKENIFFTYEKTQHEDVAKIESKIVFLTSLENYGKNNKVFFENKKLSFSKDYEFDCTFLLTINKKFSENLKLGIVEREFKTFCVIIERYAPSRKFLENKILEEAAKAFTQKNINLAECTIKKD